MVFSGGRYDFSAFSLTLTLALAATIPIAAEAGILSALARFLIGGPIEIEERMLPVAPESQAAAALSALGAANRPPVDPAERRVDSAIGIIREDAIIAPLNPLGTPPLPDAVPTGQIFVYAVRPGDTLTGIAESFDVTVNTILWANGIPQARPLRPGEELVILPVTGVRHEVRKGDTVSGIAKKYRAAIEDLLQFNGLAPDEALEVGTVVIVPNGELPQSAPLIVGGGRRSLAPLPVYDGFYRRPIAAGRRSRALHGFNGVDLADTCGLPAFAAADGTVLLARLSGWNGGYGRYLVISHPNSTQTLYAHLRDLIAKPGQRVRQGEVVGTIGSSGNSTGCHVHFEVRGARNPF